MGESEFDDEIAGLVTLAQSRDYRDRVVAASGLAQLAHLPATTGWLQKLVLDPEDTAVTEAAARALRARSDESGITALVFALAEADDNQADWIESGVGEALGQSSMAREQALATTRRITRTASEKMRAGGERLADILSVAGLA